MVSFWDHMKSVLKTIKKKPALALVSRGTPARSPALSATLWLSGIGWHGSPLWRRYSLLGGCRGQVQRPMTLSFVSSNFPLAFSVCPCGCWGELGEPHLEHWWPGHAALMWPRIEAICLELPDF